MRPVCATGIAVVMIVVGAADAHAQRAPAFNVHEATIADIQRALQAKRITTVGVVEQYLRRIKAYNGTCVNEPQGILGPVTTIARAGQINALSTLNLRPAARERWGFDARKARSLTDRADSATDMPDALETAAAQDRAFARTGRLVGPLHGVVMAIKDQYDTKDMRTTSGGDAQYANDRPPDDATFVAKLREAGAIILAKANLAEYAVDGARSSFGGTFCNPYDTEREPGMSSAGSGTSVAANLVTCAIGEETVVSVRWPAAVNSIVGLAPTKELVSTDGMIGAGTQHARRTDVPDGGRHGADPRRDRRLRPEGSVHRAERRAHAAHAVSRGHHRALAGGTAHRCGARVSESKAADAGGRGKRRPRRARHRGAEDARAPRSSIPGPTGRCFRRASRGRRRSSCPRCSRGSIHSRAIRSPRSWRCTPTRRGCPRR